VPVLSEKVDSSGNERRVVVLEVTGEVDGDRLEELSGLFAQTSDHQTVVADLSEVSFIDSSGLRLLLDQYRRCQESGHELILRSPSAVVLRLLELTKLTDFFTIESA
jgi:anti-anti-sigma factor